MRAQIVRIAGDEADIVAISRVCTGRETEPVEDEQVKKSIFNLIRMRHWSPFEFAHVWVEIEAPIYVMRQWMRHSGAWMEKSRRYTNDEPVYENVKMGKHSLEFNMLGYEEMLADGAKPEHARKVLPLATYTKCFWNPNLRDLLHFLRLRTSPHAQDEIRDLAIGLLKQIAEPYPNIFEAFYRYEMGEESYTAEQMEIIVEMFKGQMLDKEAREVVKIAKRRISMVEGVYERLSPEVGDSAEDSSSPTGTPSDGETVSEEV